MIVSACSLSGTPGSAVLLFFLFFFGRGKEILILVALLHSVYRCGGGGEGERERKIFLGWLRPN